MRSARLLAGLVAAAAAAVAALAGPLDALAPAASSPSPAAEPWLGLNGNSAGGAPEEFVEHHVVYDRGGAVELRAGATLAQLAPGLERSIKAGMIPVVTIEFDGYSSCTFGRACLPTDPKALSEYARGFVSTAEAILARWPAAPIAFEAINEPWGYGTPSQYAAFLALLLPEVARSRVPIADVYVSAAGNGWIAGLYQAQPQLRSEIRAWYLHPYAKERKPGEGMAEVPAIRAEMASGSDNIIVSELGFCASSSSSSCLQSSAPASDPAEAAEALRGELAIGLGYHREGWLRALLVYARGDGGWAMEDPTGGLTASGRMLEAFGDRYG
jgi:hypothetical protein